MNHPDVKQVDGKWYGRAGATVYTFNEATGEFEDSHTLKRNQAAHVVSSTTADTRVETEPEFRRMGNALIVTPGRSQLHVDVTKLRDVSKEEL